MNISIPHLTMVKSMDSNKEDITDLITDVRLDFETMTGFRNQFQTLRKKMLRCSIEQSLFGSTLVIVSKIIHSSQNRTMTNFKVQSKSYFLTSMICRPVSGVFVPEQDEHSTLAQDEANPWRPPRVGEENGSFRVIYRPSPNDEENVDDADNDTKKSSFIGEVFTWCSKCNKWLATNEEPHTKKFHYRFTALNRTKLPDKHPALVVMKKLKQLPNKKNAVWATSESLEDPRIKKNKSGKKGKTGDGSRRKQKKRDSSLVDVARVQQDDSNNNEPEMTSQRNLRRLAKVPKYYAESNSDDEKDE